MKFAYTFGRFTTCAALLLLLAATPARAQFDADTRDVTKAGTTPADFLGIPVGARATAMGGAITASVGDGTAMYWNPAGLASMTNGAFTAEYAEWLAGLAFNYAALSFPTSAGTFGVAITSMRSDEMDVTTVENQMGTGETFDAASYAVALSYGRQLTDRFSVGGTVKYVTERISLSNAQGIAMDVGTLFVTPFRGIRLGASISNFGTKMRITGDDLSVVVDIDPNAEGNNESNRGDLRTDEFDLPLQARIGLAGEVFDNQQARLTLAVDAISPNNSEQYLNLGAELGFMGNLVMIRGGYAELFLDESVRRLTFGGGLHYRFGALNLAVDYAFEELRYFTDVHRFTVALGF